MSGLFNFSPEEMLSFFAVLVRFGTLIAVLPFLGDRMIPAPVKVLLSLAVTLALFPALVRTGQVRPGDAVIWGSTAGGIVSTIGMETLFALALGFTAKMAFEAVNFGGNLIGNFMGFASATTYDPHQESQTQVVAEVQLALAMLVFLTIDGHHLMIQAALGSYQIVGVGGATGVWEASFGQRLIAISAQVIHYSLQLAAPVAISLFSVNVAFGVISKAMPQMNVLVLSFAVTALIGLTILFLGMPEFQSAASSIVSQVGDWMNEVAVALRGSGR